MQKICLAEMQVNPIRLNEWEEGAFLRYHELLSSTPEALIGYLIKKHNRRVGPILLNRCLDETSVLPELKHNEKCARDNSYRANGVQSFNDG
jgi:hypothetical protein